MEQFVIIAEVAFGLVRLVLQITLIWKLFQSAQFVQRIRSDEKGSELNGIHSTDSYHVAYHWIYSSGFCYIRNNSTTTKFLGEQMTPINYSEAFPAGLRALRRAYGTNVPLAAVWGLEHGLGLSGEESECISGTEEPSLKAQDGRPSLAT